MAMQRQARLFGGVQFRPAVAAQQIKIGGQFEPDHLDELADGLRIPVGRVPIVNE